MRSFLVFLGHRAPICLALGFGIGIFVPEIDGLSDFLIPPMVVAMLATAMIQIDPTRLLRYFRHPIKIMILTFALLIIMPLLGSWIIVFWSVSDAVAMAMILLWSAPPLASSPGLSSFLKLDSELTLTVMVIASLIFPVTSALCISLLDMDPGRPREGVDLLLLARLFLLTGLAVLFAVLVRYWIGTARIKANAQMLDGISVLLMIGFAFLLLNQVSWGQLQDIDLMLTTSLMAFALNWGPHLVTLLLLLIYLVLTRQFVPVRLQQIGAIAVLNGNRNLALFVAALPADQAADLFLFLALIQAPIYLTPLLGQYLYRGIFNNMR